MMFSILNVQTPKSVYTSVFGCQKDRKPGPGPQVSLILHFYFLLSRESLSESLLSGLVSHSSRIHYNVIKYR